MIPCLDVAMYYSAVPLRAQPEGESSNQTEQSFHPRPHPCSVIAGLTLYNPYNLSLLLMLLLVLLLLLLLLCFGCCCC